MSVRLQLASLWMPRYLMGRELETIAARTNAALDGLLARHDIAAPSMPEEQGGSIEQRRLTMARDHELRVRALIEGMGREEAIRAAREALFITGQELGQEARDRLGVGDSKRDLVKAAGVMYRILGIVFTIKEGPEGTTLEVHRCALSNGYSRDACLMLSAVDEGVVSGLSSKAHMRFSEHITGGSSRCIAAITFEEGA